MSDVQWRRHNALADLPPGWFHHGPTVLALLDDHQPRHVVELGSWRGASAIAMARVLRQWGGTVTCVDTFTDDAIHGGIDQDLDAPQPTPNRIAEFTQNLIAAHVAASVRIVVAPTLEAAAVWHDPIDFLFIDADHDFEACLHDLEAWVPHVRPGGLIAGDDYGNPMFPGVRMAWNYFATVTGMVLEQRPSPGAAHGMPLIVGHVKEDL